jgi:FkbM family methyltransferase
MIDTSRLEPFRFDRYTFHLRPPPAGMSDRFIIKEVFVQDCYQLQRVAAAGVQLRTVLDIGGHIGSCVAKVHSLWPDARVVTVEPDPDNFTLLQMNVGNLRRSERRPNVLANVGIGYQARARHLIRNLFHTGSGYTTDEAVSHNQPGHEHAGMVPLQTLEEVAAAAGIADEEPIDLLKIDCEGAEIEAMEKMSPAFAARVRVVVGEYHCEKARILELAPRAFPHLRFKYNHAKARVGSFFGEPA